MGQQKCQQTIFSPAFEKVCAIHENDSRIPGPPSDEIFTSAACSISTTIIYVWLPAFFVNHVSACSKRAPDRSRGSDWHGEIEGKLLGLILYMQAFKYQDSRAKTDSIFGHSLRSTWLFASMERS